MKVKFKDIDASGEPFINEGELLDVIKGIAVIDLGRDWPVRVNYNDLIED